MSAPDDLAVALALADQADAVTLARFGALDLQVDTKPDLTPVSDADRAVETGLREALGRARPDDSVLGEEFGGSTTLTGRQWIIDPIDGTKNFVRGVPVWASLIALLDDGVPRGRCGQRARAAAPVVGRQRRRARSRRSATRRPAGSRFPQWRNWIRPACRSPACPDGPQLGLRDRFIELTDAVWRVRAYGDFLSYCLVAEGAVDIAAEPEVSVWDLAPLDILVREAGGTFTSLDGTAGPARRQRGGDQRPAARPGAEQARR